MKRHFLEEVTQVANSHIRCPSSPIFKGNIKVTMTCQFLLVKLTELLKNDKI